MDTNIVTLSDEIGGRKQTNGIGARGRVHLIWCHSLPALIQHGGSKLSYFSNETPALQLGYSINLESQIGLFFMLFRATDGQYEYVYLPTR